MRWIELGRSCQEHPAPDFRLKTVEGYEVTRSQFRQRSSLVLLFLPDSGAPDAARFLARMRALEEDVRRSRAKLYIISPRVDHARLPLLHDAENRVRAKYVAAIAPCDDPPQEGEPFIVILDRYGALAHAAAGALSRDTLAAEIVEWLRAVQHECPE